MRALRWFQNNEQVSWFDADAPCHGMVQRLEKRGLIELDKRRRYQLTEFARKMLREATTL